jgi:hypothetical protein
MINGCGFTDPSRPRCLNLASAGRPLHRESAGGIDADRRSKTTLRLELKSRFRVESVLSVSFSAAPESTHAGFLLAHSIPPRWGYLFVTGV